MDKKRRSPRYLAPVLAVMAVLVTVIGIVAPSVARAAEPDIARNSTMYIATHCLECNNLPHEDFFTGVGYSTGSFNLGEGVTISSVKSHDESLVTARINPTTGEVEVRPAGGKTGTTYITVTFSDNSTAVCEETVQDVYDHWNDFVASCGSDEAAREELDWHHYATLVVDDLLPDEITIPSSGESYLPFSYASSDDMRNLMTKATYNVADPSVLTISESGLITPLKAGTTNVTMTITDLAHSNVTFTDTIAITVADDDEAVPEPWAADGSLLPYTIKDGVMTFDGRPDLGAWYQLDLDLGAGVTSGGYIGGGSLWTMTISASSLDASDPLYDADGWENGPFWVRADNRGAYTGLVLTVPEGKALSTSLEGSGTLVPSGNGSILLVQLSGPATLRASVAGQTVLKNESGATLTHTPNSGELGGDDVWSTLTFVTEWIGGDEAQAAVDSLVASVDGVVGHPYVYDLHLLSIDGKVFPIPDGDSVTVTLPIPEGLSAEGLRVFHVADDGTVTDMNATVDAEAGTVSFTTTHFSTFVLANVKTNDGGAGGASGEKTADTLAATGDAGSIVALLTAASGSMALLGASQLRKRS